MDNRLNVQTCAQRLMYCSVSLINIYVCNIMQYHAVLLCICVLNLALLQNVSCLTRSHDLQVLFLWQINSAFCFSSGHLKHFPETLTYVFPLWLFRYICCKLFTNKCQWVFKSNSGTTRTMPIQFRKASLISLCYSRNRGLKSCVHLHL